MREYRYTTPHGIQVTRTASKTNFRKGLQHLLRDLDQHRGIYLSLGYEYPGRYSRWDIASTRPPLEIIAYDRRVEFRPLNARGSRILRLFDGLLAGHPHWESFGFEGETLAGRLKPLPAPFPEGERSKQPSAFSILWAVIAEGFGAGARGVFRLRPVVPVRTYREETAARRPQRPAPVSVRRHLVHGPQEGGRGALPIRIRRRGEDDARAGAGWRSDCAARAE